MKKISILIVDDHTLFRDVWSVILSENNRYAVIGATGDADRAVELARDKRPEIILLDINMRPVNGFEILKMIRKYSPSARVIAVSMHTQPAYVKKMLRFGARGYITKNSSSEELLKAIEEVMMSRTYICNQVQQLLERDPDEADNIHHLSERELEVIAYIREGFSSKEIALQLNIERKTVEVHRHNIFKKLNVKNAAALIDFINTHGY